MTERGILVIWDCSCPKEIDDIPPVQTKLVGAEICFDPEGYEGEKWVVYLSFIERCSRCKKQLGEGYGDPYFFATEEEAEEYKKSLTIGEWTYDV